MENQMHELLLDICKRKIDNGMSLEDILDFIKTKNVEDMFSKIDDRLKDYIYRQETLNLQRSS